MSDDENRGYGRRRSAHVPTVSISPMEEMARKREPKPSYGSKPSYKIPKKPRLSTSSDKGSSGYSRDDNDPRDRRNEQRRRSSYDDTRSPLSRRDSRDSNSSGGFNRKRGGHLKEELSVAENDTSYKDLIDDNDMLMKDLSFKPVDREGESGLPDFNRDFKKTLPKDEQEIEERKSAPAPEPVKVDWSISKVIRLLRMNDRHSELDVVKRERRESENGDVILVERHEDEDLKDVTDPDPNDIEFQNQRLSHGELTKDEKKRWKRRYKGEAVFMLPRGHAEKLKRNYERNTSRGRGGERKGDRRSNPIHEALRREHPNPNTMEIKPRLGRGSQRGRSDGSTVNRLQQLAGGNSPQRFPRIKEERRSRSPREGHRYRDSYSSRRSRSRSRSRERRVRSRSGDRSPSPPPLPPSSNYPPPPPLPSRSPYSRSRSRSRSPPRRRRSSSASVSPPPSSRTYMSYSR